MGKKFEELKSLVNAFGGTVEPTDDTVADLICKLVKVACKSYEITAVFRNSEWTINNTFAEILEAVNNKENLILIADVRDGAYEVFNWISYVNNDYAHCVVFSRTEGYNNEMWIKTLYIFDDDTTEYHEEYFTNE